MQKHSKAKLDWIGALYETLLGNEADLFYNAPESKWGRVQMGHKDLNLENKQWVVSE